MTTLNAAINKALDQSKFGSVDMVRTATSGTAIATSVNIQAGSVSGGIAVTLSNATVVNNSALGTSAITSPEVRLRQ